MSLPREQAGAALLASAQALLAERRYAEAEVPLRALLQAVPQHLEALFLLGVAATEQRRIAEALDWLRRAVALDNSRPDILTQLARVQSLARGEQAALALAERALALGAADALTLDTLGVVFSRANQHGRAAELFARAAALVPGNAGYQFNLASSRKFLGEFAAAEAAYEACLAADPQFWKAYPSLSQLRRQTPGHNHLARYTALLPQARTVDAQLHLRMAMAKEYEDLGDHPEAFRQLGLGKAAKRAQLRYSAADDAALFAALRQRFTPPPAIGSGEPSREPIFVLGMPRTGTTLVERILSSHPRVHSVGELQNFGLALKRASGSRTPQLLDADLLAGSGGLNWPALGAAYIASTRPATGHTPHFVDKMPLNFLYIGYIRQALPNARIICLRRHPLDTCLSNYRQLFALGFSYYNYAYDLLDTGRYYVQFERLMAHWRQCFADAVLEVQYEALVEQPEAQIRRLLDYCGLPWDARCLHFERNPAAVATASAVQVRQSIYKSAVNRWQGLATELAPLRQQLLSEGVALGGDRLE